MPSAPIITGITPGDTTLSVAFTAGANGGAAISNYKYSTDGGSTFTAVSPASTSSPILITGLINETTYDVQILAVNVAGDGAPSATTQGTPSAPTSPTITVAPGTLASALTTTYGTASAAATFTASGSALTSDIIVTAPSGLEVSTNAASDYGATVTLTNVSGSVPLTTVYVRLATNAAAGNYNSATISLTSDGATTQTVLTTPSGNTASPKTLTITGLTGTDKPYDGNTSASFTGTPAYSGLENGETFSVTGTPSASFATAAAADGKTINVTGYTAPSANYTVTQPTLTANITKVPLTINGISGVNKVYSGTTAATLSGTASYVGLVNGENFTVTGTPSASFASANVGTAIAITVTGYTAPSGNYTVSQPTGLSADITTKALTITGVSGVNRAYTGLTTATLSGTAAYSGLVNGESFAVTGTPSANFASANVGTAIPITVTGYTAPSGNYTVTQPTGLTANITTVALTITGVSGVSRVYNGTTAATLSGTASYVGLVNGETFTVSGTPSATFANATVGTGKAITVSGYTAPSSNYTLTQPALTADITKATPTITTAPTASSVNNAQTLAQSTLTGGAATGVSGALAGTFAFTTPATTPAVGTTSQSVTFTPTDTVNYNTTTANVSVTVTAAGYAGTGEFNKISATSDVTDGFYVVAFGTTFAMSNFNNGTFFANNPITPTANKIINPGAPIVWRIQTHVNGGKTIYNETSLKYVSYDGGGNNNASAVDLVSGGSERWTITWATSVFTIQNITSTTRYLQYNTVSPRFACYTGSQQDITLYKLTPVITGAATATAFATTYGTASVAQTFSVSGSGLSANLVANAPAGFEVSSDGTTYDTTATFTPVSGVASGTLRIRLAATATVTGIYNSKNITLTSSGATTVNITTAASGNSVSPATLTYTANSASKLYGATVPSLTGTVTGFVNGENQAGVTTGTLTFTTTATASSPGGTYPITGSGLSAANYTFVQAAGNSTAFRINPATVSTFDLTTTKNQAVTFDAGKLVLLANDAGVTLTVSAVTSPSAHGTAVLNGNNTITYTPANDYVGSDSFTYTLSDNVGGSSVGTVTVNIADLNAIYLSIQTVENVPTVTASGIPGQTYHLQYSEDGGATWDTQNPIEITAGENGVIIYSDVNYQTHNSRMFRLTE